MLSDAQIAQYRDKGYVVPDYRLSDETLESIKKDHDRLLARYPSFRDNCSALLSYDLSFLNYARDPKILDMAEQLIGPDIALWNMSFFAKPALNGKKTPYHQDGEYWPIRPLATCTVWIAVDAATVENGCLRYIPGSHRDKRLMAHEQKDNPEYVLQQELKSTEFDESIAEDLILEPGQMALHDVFLAHGSERNSSDKPRRGITRGGNNLAHHSLFLLRGVDRSGRNDFQVRPEATGR